eukprot:gb/GECG01007662.1/.p1 GENE.gb/GECG01007662.1/~~gb/GECG01007662.1/.p1  ORF type:complete len:210 (+),score=38.41 gb/GECG01007662.1/:1-630(+)
MMDELDSSTSSHESQSANAVVEGLLRLSVANFMRGKPLQAGIITPQSSSSSKEDPGEEGKRASSARRTEKAATSTSSSSSSSTSTADMGTNDSSRLSSSFIVSPVQHSKSSTAKGNSNSISGNKENEDSSTVPTAPTVSVCDAPVRDMQEDTEGSKGNEEIFKKPLHELMEEKVCLPPLGASIYIVFVSPTRERMETIAGNTKEETQTV